MGRSVRTRRKASFCLDEAVGSQSRVPREGTILEQSRRQTTNIDNNAERFGTINFILLPKNQRYNATTMVRNLSIYVNTLARIVAESIVTVSVT